MYRALYRKWRPRRFADVIGQEAIVSALSGQIETGRIGHAYLFTGTRGTGKTTCAKIFAAAVNCESREGADPCGECSCCLGLEDGSLLDVTEIDAASNNSVDDVRNLRDETAYRPSRCQYKVYIIDEVHMLSTSAFNALLKIMEEPPSHVIFILATTEIHKVPATILSRCQRYDFVRVPAEKVAALLLHIAQGEGIELDEEAASLIARLADGAVRDALSLLDTCAGVGGPVDAARVRALAGVADKSYLFALSRAVTNSDLSELLRLIDELRNQSIDVKRLTEELVYHYRNLLLAAVQPDGAMLLALGTEERARYAEVAPSVGEAVALRAMRRLAAAMDKMARSPEPRLELELALFDLAQPETPAAAASPVVQQKPSAAVLAPAAQQKAPVSAPSRPEQEPSMASAATASQMERPQVPSATTTAPAVQEETEEAASQAPAPPPEGLERPEASTPALPPQMPQQVAPGANEPFALWGNVVQRMAEVDRMLYSYMKSSMAYFDGKRVLIDGGDMFLSYMREYDSAAEKIKTVIAEVTGTRYSIGPYTGGQGEKKAVAAKDTLKDWEEKGVPVEYV